VNVKAEIRRIVSDQALTDLEKVERLRALIPASVRNYPLARLSSLPPELVPAFEDSLEVMSACHRITEKAIADKIAEN